MALDATVAGASANSYLTVADADVLAPQVLGLGTYADTWQGAPIDRKELALIRASHDLDRYKRTTSAPYSESQAMVFPRATDYAGDPVAPYIHGNVQRATVAQAAYLLANASVLDAAASRRAQGLITSATDDGSWTQSIDPAFNLMSPDAVMYLGAVPGYRRPTLHSVPISSGIGSGWDPPVV